MSERPTNTLGKTSMILGVVASTFVFSVGLCAGVGKQQGWLHAAGPLLLIVGGTFTFLGFVGAILGFFGLFSRPRTVALVGLLLGIGTVLLFAAIVNSAK